MAKSIDLGKLSLKELKALRKDIEKTMGEVEQRARQAALVDAEKAAQKHGFTLAELTGGGRKRPKKAAPAKYRHPENPALTWSGRGRQPTWFKEAVAKGVKPEKLAI